MPQTRDMVARFPFHLLCTFCIIITFIKPLKAEKFYPASDTLIQYTGRIDFSNANAPKFWQPGVYSRARFSGSTCSVIMEDEVLWGKSHNYIELVIDDTMFYRLHLKSARDTISLPVALNTGSHTILVCKNTEANIGYLQLIGFICEQLLPLKPKPARKIEFFGDSITCGTGSDESVIACGKGKWEDQHNAFLSYGPVCARKLKAQWSLSAVSGIGMVHSCCNMNVLMPEVYDKVSMGNDTIKWDFDNYQPDVVTICLGQNDGIGDSAEFCSAYVAFIGMLRQHYPNSYIVCLTSPMADASLRTALQHYLTGIVSYFNSEGDGKVFKYFFSRQYHKGCDGHPDVAEHALIGEELALFLGNLLHWNS